MKFVVKEKPEDCSIEDYLFYLCQNKSILGLSWDDIADIMSAYEGHRFDESKYRRYCKANFRDRISEEIEQKEELSIEEKFDIAKETQKLRDERTQLNALYRQATREDFLRDIAIECAKKVAENHEFYDLSSENVIRRTSENEGILLISDWHYGIGIDNHWNVYNPEVCRERLSKLEREVEDFIDRYHIYKVTVLNLGDLISGRIHSQIRIENREDVVSQVISVSELLGQFINDIAECGVWVDYYDCLDNHSRIEPNKKESLRLESMARIITWYLEERFKSVPRVSINFNKYSDDIITFKCLGWNVAGVHGDLDSQKSVVKNMRGMIDEKPNLICTAHRHHFSADEDTGCVVVSNPSLMGTDQYAESKRLVGTPAQTFIVVTDYNPVYAIHRIVL